MREEKNFICPVCGLAKLREPLYNNSSNPSYEICVCCGFEFGFDDNLKRQTYDSYRTKWLEEGAKWFRQELKPDGWNLQEQLKNINK